MFYDVIGYWMLRGMRLVCCMYGVRFILYYYMVHIPIIWYFNIIQCYGVCCKDTKAWIDCQKVYEIKTLF